MSASLILTFSLLLTAAFGQASGVKSSRVYSERGQAKFVRGDLKGALADYERARALAPADVVAFMGRGNVRYFKRDYDGAVKDFSTAVVLAPGLDEPLYIRGLVRGLAGDLRTRHVK